MVVVRINGYLAFCSEKIANTATDSQQLKKNSAIIFSFIKKHLNLHHDFEHSKYSLVVAMLKDVGFV